MAKGLGVASFRHPSFGNFPKEEARTYGDNTFVAMMWIKVHTHRVVLCLPAALLLEFVAHILLNQSGAVRVPADQPRLQRAVPGRGCGVAEGPCARLLPQARDRR